MNMCVLLGAVVMFVVFPAGIRAEMSGSGAGHIRVADSEDSFFRYGPTAAGMTLGRAPCASCGNSVESCHFGHYDLWTDYCFEKQLLGQEHPPCRTWHPLRSLLDTIHFSIFPFRDCRCHACTHHRQFKGAPANALSGLFGWRRHESKVTRSRNQPKHLDFKHSPSVIEMRHSELNAPVGSRGDVVPVQEPDFPVLMEAPSAIEAPEVPADSGESSVQADADKQESQQQELQGPVEAPGPVIPRNTMPKPAPKPAKSKDELHPARLVPAAQGPARDPSHLGNFIETD